MLYFEVLPQGIAVVALAHVDNFEKLMDVIQEKCPRKDVMHLLHDKARTLLERRTQENLIALYWDTVPHPVYSSGAASSDLH